MAGEVFAAAVGGATAMGFAVAGLCFLRYWSQTRDRLFVYFAASFWAMAANRTALIVIGDGHEAQTYVYLVRLLAFVLILVGVIEKNRGRRLLPFPRGRDGDDEIPGNLQP